MDKFFNVIYLIAIFVLVFIVYYTVKNIIQKNRINKINENIKKKRYRDEKTYIRNYTRKLIKDLQMGNLQWIIISSRLIPEQKVEVTYNEIEKQLQCKIRVSELLDSDVSTLNKLGMTGHRNEDQLYLFNMPVNAKILTDILYYSLEKIYQQQQTQNLKLITSGG
jgi:hypothetical protein